MIDREFIKAGVSSFLASKPAKISIRFRRIIEISLFNMILRYNEVTGAQIPVITNQGFDVKANHRLYKDIQ